MRLGWNNPGFWKNSVGDTIECLLFYGKWLKCITAKLQLYQRSIHHCMYQACIKEHYGSSY